MIDLNEWKRRLAALADRLDLSEDAGYEVFAEHVYETTEATPVSELRDLARSLGAGAPVSRQQVTDRIIDAWVSREDEPVPERSADEVVGMLLDLADLANDTAGDLRREGTAGAVADALRRIRDLAA